MFDEEARKKDSGGGAPAWVMTFADLMSLLLCFFVLLLSFSEMDVSKYKQLAGSMANAFGVQREVRVKEAPKGINIIAREFSPGRPEPTPLNVVQQMTTANLKIHLDVGGQKKSMIAPKSFRHDPRQEHAVKPTERGTKVGDLADDKNQGKDGKDDSAASDEQQDAQSGTFVDQATAEEILEARERAERRRQMEANARKITAELQEQIEDGAVDVEKEGEKIIIRIREKASFGSGTADVKSSFKPVLWRLGEILETTQGRVVVAGHTDDLPISTPRYRSNWELSSARAVSVIHELLWQTAMPLQRFVVQGHGQTQPIAPNTSRANRSRNRRVEIILLQGEDKESAAEISQKGKTDKTKPAANEIKDSARLDGATASPGTAKAKQGSKDSAMKAPAAVTAQQAVQVPADAKPMPGADATQAVAAGQSAPLAADTAAAGASARDSTEESAAAAAGAAAISGVTAVDATTAGGLEPANTSRDDAGSEVKAGVQAQGVAPRVGVTSAVSAKGTKPAPQQVQDAPTEQQ